MFCKECGGMLVGDKCSDCGLVQKRRPVVIAPAHEGLSELERREQVHILRQRKKQEVWKVPEDA